MCELILEGNWETGVTFIGYREPKSISIGYDCKCSSDRSVAAGYYAASTNDNAVAIGSYVSATHKNSTVVGNNLTSKRDNSTLFKQAEITDDGLHLESGTSLISDVVCGRPVYHMCTACNQNIKHGIKWIKDGYITEGDNGNTQQYNDIELGLCFNCVLDCVLEFKAKSSWNSKVT